MFRRTLAGLVAVGFLGGTVLAAPLPVVKAGGVAYVSARDLEKQAGIAIKPLSEGVYVACSEDRCALLRLTRLTGDEVQVALDELARSLGVEVGFAEDGRAATLAMKAAAETAGSTGMPGTLAPQVEWVGLDGGKVSLAQFRGRRVLINSWASW